MYSNHLKLVTCFSVALIWFIIPLVLSDDWSYRAQNEWSHHEKTCSGERQSPIDIETKLIKVNKSLSIKMVNYNMSILNFNVENNGHTVMLKIISDQKPYISGTAFKNDIYLFEQLHFHWGGSIRRGSEHAIDGKTHSMEMHLVHFNQKYNDISTAIKKQDGIAVIGVLFDVTRKRNMHFEPIVELVSDVKYKDIARTNFNQKPVILDDLLPNNLDLFYRYEGSLTTPPCSESVTWILYPDINDIGYKQIEYFRNLMITKEVPMGDTFRELQNARDRKIEASQEIPRIYRDLKGMGTQIHSNPFIMQLSFASLLIMAKNCI